jgi:phosphoenolpyruvate synthase/pyruvate phosphate dikinase
MSEALHVVILAAGEGKRMNSAKPKVLLPVAGRPMLAQVIAAARAAGRKIGICGQAPSDYPEFAKFLVAQGIDSISLNPDSVLKTTLAIAELEAAAVR